jgi:hypothetical protein
MLGSISHVELYHSRLHRIADDSELGDRNWKLESARARAAGIDVKYAVALLH